MISPFITNAQYREFQIRQGIPEPDLKPQDNYPVMDITYKEAVDYCLSKGGRLPKWEEVENSKCPLLEWICNQNRYNVRGGWDNLSWNLRAAFRNRFEPDYRYGYIGFRCAGVAE